MTQRILVWDLPTRIFHWTLALSFTGAFLTGESERWRDFHVLLGYTVLGLIRVSPVLGLCRHTLCAFRSTRALFTLHHPLPRPIIQGTYVALRRS